MPLNRRAFIATAAAATLRAGRASAETEIKLGHVGEPGSLIGAQADEFAKRVNAKLGGKAKVTCTAPASSAATPR